MTSAKPARKPAAPADLGRRGRTFWRDVLKVYELNVDEMELLREACRTLDDCDRLRTQIETDGYMVKGSTGQSRLHPAVTELRQTRSALGKALSQLGLPDPETGEVSLPSPESRRAQQAAAARWNHQRFLQNQREEAARRGQIP